jgi:DNA-binding NtrC family response regulator
MEIKQRNIRILVIDDEEGMCLLLKNILSGSGYKVKTLSSPVKVIPLLMKEHFDIIVSDIKMADFDGVSLLKEILRLKPDQPVIMITAYGSIENAVEAIKIGAYDYITKPFQTDQILHSVAKVIERLVLIEENRSLRDTLSTIQGSTKGVIGKSKVLFETLSYAKKIAASNINVLITGESGTGKEVIAKFIHLESDRCSQPFIPVQCGLIPHDLMESELFGHIKGSFTGAINDKKGLLEEGNGGTILLDEIGDINIDIQAKLLRLLQEREIRKVGETKTRIIDIRIISATNKDITELVQNKQFREDLYYRLKTVEINIPPLRQRKEDIPLLVEYFLNIYNTLYKKNIMIEADCFKYLMSHNWPGNIRELRNVVETSATICDRGVIRTSDISYILFRETRDLNVMMTFTEMKRRVTRDFEIEYISQLLKKHKGNVAAAARDAGIDKKNLWELMKKHSLSADYFKE